MCGIVGIVTSVPDRISENVLQAMNGAIMHRGPDENGLFIEENVGLAIRRLSIIDLSSGQQPIFNHDRTKAIVFNGEIYNFQTLRDDLKKKGSTFYTRSDTEVIIQLYEKYGVDCVAYLRGMFAFAIWDSMKKTLFIARDRAGQKPLLYSHLSNGDLIFGSEFQALLQYPDISNEINYKAIDSYLSYACVPSPQTAFKNIRKLEPGHWLRWKNGKVSMERYWFPNFSKKINITPKKAEEETLRVLREATRLRLIAEVPLGAFLSGGVDSSTIAALMAQESGNPIKTFSIGFEEHDFSELKYARRVAKHIGAEHNEFIVKPNAMEVLPKLIEHYGEPYADPSAIPTHYVSKETRKYVTVALNGDGGDESFAGYERYSAMRVTELYNRLPKSLSKILIEKPIEMIPTSELKRSRLRDIKRLLQAASLPKAQRYFHWVTVFRELEKMRLYTKEFKAKVSDNQPLEFLNKWFLKANGLGIVDTALLTDQMTYLPNDLLVKVDIASMANSLEARSPFLDHKVIEFAASLPERIKMRHIATKSLLKRVAAKLVPREVVHRRKMGFGVPIGKWFRNEMKDFVMEVLLSEKCAKRGIFRPKFVSRLLNDHMECRRDCAGQIWSLLMLELWFQKFVD